MAAFITPVLEWVLIVPGGGFFGVPRETLARLGESPRELTRFGSSRVLAGGNLVLKVGPPDRATREAFVLGEVGLSGLLGIPSLIDAGDGWLLLRAVDVAEPSDSVRWHAGALADLARLHETFAGRRVLNDGSFAMSRAVS